MSTKTPASSKTPTAEQVKTLANSEPLLADAMLRLADSAKQLLSSGLTDRALYVLLTDLHGLPALRGACPEGVMMTEKVPTMLEWVTTRVGELLASTEEHDCVSVDVVAVCQWFDEQHAAGHARDQSNSLTSLDNAAIGGDSVISRKQAFLEMADAAGATLEHSFLAGAPVAAPPAQPTAVEAKLENCDMCGRPAVLQDVGPTSRWCPGCCQRYVSKRIAGCQPEPELAAPPVPVAAKGITIDGVPLKDVVMRNMRRQRDETDELMARVSVELQTLENARDAALAQVEAKQKTIDSLMGSGREMERALTASNERAAKLEAELAGLREANAALIKQKQCTQCLGPLPVIRRTRPEIELQEDEPAAPVATSERTRYRFLIERKEYFHDQRSITVAEADRLHAPTGGCSMYQCFLEQPGDHQDIPLSRAQSIDLTTEPSIYFVPPATYAGKR